MLKPFVSSSGRRPAPDWRRTSDPMVLMGAVREGSYQFHGMTDATMNHGEGCSFIQLGKYMERSCALPVLLDAYFSGAGKQTSWTGWRAGKLRRI